ncbi:hypothetical protein BDV93DRAFT_606006 [Ceratobasidium sp. AG-I]|nr:hypothetical protein BDV93DRAFT_606006 [Ceratobasidium sp. AG-I]
MFVCVRAHARLAATVAAAVHAPVAVADPLLAAVESVPRIDAEHVPDSIASHRPAGLGCSPVLTSSLARTSSPASAACRIHPAVPCLPCGIPPASPDSTPGPSHRSTNPNPVTTLETPVCISLMNDSRNVHAAATPRFLDVKCDTNENLATPAWD